MTEKKLQVVFCTDGIFPHSVGGMQRHSRLLIEELAKMVVLDIIVIHPHYDKTVFNQSLNIREIGIARDKPHYSYMLNEYRYSKKVFAALESYPDAIIYSQGLSVWYNIKKIGARLIINPHGLEFFQGISPKEKFKARRFAVLFKYLFSHATKIISLGGQLTQLLTDNIKNAKQKIVILPNAVNVPAPVDRKFDKEPMQFLFVGRFAANKGINILIETIQKLNEEDYGNELVFNLVGKGPLFEHFTTTFTAPNLYYLGFADDDKLVELYKENDVFVFPTLFEGMPTVVLEAMSFGMPVIVTDTGATKELVDHTNGFIIEKNDPDSLRHAIVKFFQMAVERRKELSDNSRKKVLDNFTWKIVAQKHYELFKSF